MKKVISVRFKENGKSYYFDPGDAVIHTGAGGMGWARV